MQIQVDVLSPSRTLARGYSFKSGVPGGQILPGVAEHLSTVSESCPDSIPVLDYFNNRGKRAGHFHERGETFHALRQSGS